MINERQQLCNEDDQQGHVISPAIHIPEYHNIYYPLLEDGK